MDFTIIQQGRFTQGTTAAAVTLSLRSDWDWIRVYNETVSYAAGAGAGAEFYFQRGMTDGRGLVYVKEATIGALVPTQIAAAAGFFYVDSSLIVPGANTALTGITAANPPVVTSATLPSVGDIVRFNNLSGATTGQPEIAGIDFTVTASGGGTFTIGNISLVNSDATTGGFYRVIPYDAMFYPRRRVITWVENAVRPKIYMSVTHGYTVGQEVRFVFKGGAALWGPYAAMDGQSATIVAVNVTRAGSEPNNGGTANNIQVDFDTSTFGSWNVFGAGKNQSFPSAFAVPFTPAQVVPIGEDTGQALTSGTDLLADATRNVAILGVRLVSGALSPAGVANNVIYWVAGKSFSVDNQ